MSAVIDALAALKNAVLLQERLEVIRRELDGLSSNVRRLDERVIDMDRRVSQIEGYLRGRAEASTRRDTPRIEG